MSFIYLYSFVLALCLSHVFIPILIRYSGQWGLVDDPADSARKLHERVIPRSGGIGIVMAAAIAVLFLLPADQTLTSYILASLAIAGFGLLDDIVELKPSQKILGQAVGVLIAMSGGMLFTDLPLLGSSPDWAVHLVTFVFVLAVINGVNFSDGMDGLAAGTALMALVLIFVLAVEAGNVQVAVVSLAIAAAILGFLRFNTHPAAIFMGDAGSQFLGFSLAWLAITVSQEGFTGISPLMPVIILGIPVMDILQVVPVRLYKHLPLPGPDREHFHHQVAKLGFHQNEVVAIIYLLQAILLSCAFVYRYTEDIELLAFYSIFIIVVLGLLLLANASRWTVRPVDAISEPAYVNRSRLFRRLGELHPYTAPILGALITGFFFCFSILSSELTDTQVYLIFWWAVLLLGLYLVNGRQFPLAIGRLASYSATIVLVWGTAVSTVGWPYGTYVDASLAVLAVALLLSIRITRKRYFRLTNGDLLVLLAFAVLSPLLLQELGQASQIVSTVTRLFVLLYACEYVLARGEKSRAQLTLVAVMALAMCLLHL